MSELILWFEKSQTVLELARTFYAWDGATEKLAVRGKKAGAYQNAGTFQWTPAVKALAIILLTSLLRNLKHMSTFLPHLDGGRGSLASSLDYALSKQPQWLFSMFGSDEQGNSQLRALLFRSNAGIRRIGSVGISLNEQVLPPDSIRVFVNDVQVADPEDLERMVEMINSAHLNDTREMRVEMREYDNQTDGPWRLGKAQYVSQSEESYDSGATGETDMLQPVAMTAQNENIYLFEQLQFKNLRAAHEAFPQRRASFTPTTRRSARVVGRMVQGKHLFEELTYQTCDYESRRRFEQWIADMTPERDGEWGLDREKEGRTIPGFLRWIREHNQSFIENGLFRTFIWRDRISKEMVATATIGADDRGVRERYVIHGDGQLGGINVRWDLRYKGIGRYIANCIENHFLQFASRQQKSVLIHTCNYNRDGVPEPFLKRLGYARNSVGPVHTDFGILPLWSKAYQS